MRNKTCNMSRDPGQQDLAPLTSETSRCPNCGSVLPPEATNFCPSCGTKIVTLPALTQHAPASGYYPPLPPPSPVSTGPYKAIIGILLIVTILFGVAWYAAGRGPLFSLGTSGYRYQLANPPDPQSIQPPSTSTPTPTPQDVIWNTCGTSPGQACSMNATGWREGTVPDTYDYFAGFTSDVPVSVYFFTLGQFVQFTVCHGDLSCVSGAYDSIAATTSESQQAHPFKLAEGCADYVAIYVSSNNGVMHPNVAAVKNPASYPTGYCGQA